MYKPSLKERIIHRIWTIFIPIFAIYAIVWMIEIFNFNVEHSGWVFAIGITALPCIILWWYILWMLDRPDPVVQVWNFIQWIISKFKK